MTAQEWVNNYFEKQIINEDIFASKSGIIESHIIFAKHYVKKALEAASKKAFAQSTRSNMTSNGDLTCIHLGEVSVNKESILNSYPEENIV